MGAAAILPEGASLERTNQMVKQVEAAVSRQQEHRLGVQPGGPELSGWRWTEVIGRHHVFPAQTLGRTHPVGQTAGDGEFYGKTAGIKEGLPLAFAPPAIQGLGQTGGFEFYLQNKGDGGVRRLAHSCCRACWKKPTSSLSCRASNPCGRPIRPNCIVNVDTEKARSMGIAVADIYNTLAATLGQLLRERLQQKWAHLPGADAG